MFSFAVFIILVTSKLVSGYIVVLSGTRDVIQGATAYFKAEVFDENGNLSPATYIFYWSDNVVPRHTANFESKSPAFWNVTYDSSTPSASYKVSVKVLKTVLFLETTVGTAVMEYNLTKFIQGDVILSQGNHTRNKYVSNNMPVNHTIVLEKSYLDYLNKTKNFMRTFWFVDCIYYGPQPSLDFLFNYSKADSVHYVEALLVALNYKNLTKSSDFFHFKDNVIRTNSSDLNNTLVVTTPQPSKNISVDNKSDNEYFDQALMDWLANFNTSQYRNTSRLDGYCLNSSIIPMNPNSTFGFFRTNLSVRAPVKISPINGTNWLMDGEVLNINVSCNGSSPYSFCILLKSGLYNITGNETCREETVIRNCSIGIKHLFKKPSEYTLVVIISNSVSKVVKPIAVNIYKVKKHAQLSVIIVPVSFSLIAIILIIFGVAYYVQSKHKYTVEVADFDFGNQTSNMEYKTFRERLRESISHSFLKSNGYQDDDTSWSESVPSNRKYGSMQ